MQEEGGGITMLNIQTIIHSDSEGNYKAKDIISQSWNWINENQDNISNWIGIIKSLFSKNQGGTPNAPIPPINQ